MDIQIVGVVGLGVMGRGIAQTLAQADIQAIGVDITPTVLEEAEVEIYDNVRMHSLFTNTGSEVDPDTVVKKIHFSTDYQDLASADFIIENVPEKRVIKSEVYRLLDKTCQPRCIFASNTSAMPITGIASMTQRPQEVIGMHFMNPAPLTKMVELIPGHHTSQETIKTAQSLLTRIDKEYILVNDSPGFISNRVLMLMINEAIYLLQDQVASAEDVDGVFRRCLGHKMGPLETADLIGLDTILFSLEVLYENFNDNKFLPCPLLEEKVTAGQLGRKSGRGFYTYSI